MYTEVVHPRRSAAARLQLRAQRRNFMTAALS